jgi:hypothetical protein
MLLKILVNKFIAINKHNTAVTIHLQQTSICDYCDKLWRVVSNCDKCWWMLTIYAKFWQILTFSDIFWHFMSLRSDVLWHFVTVNGFRPLIFVTFCHILSHIVTHCHGLTHVIRLCHKLSQVVRIASHFVKLSIFYLEKRKNKFFYKFYL